MSEFKLQKLVRELIDVCEAPASPEHFIEKLTALDADFANRPTSVDKCFNELKDSAPETSRDQFSSKYSDPFFSISLISTLKNLAVKYACG